MQYDGEEGIDAGGPSREFYSLLFQEIFKEETGLFIKSENKFSLQPHPLSSLIPDY